MSIKLKKSELKVLYRDIIGNSPIKDYEKKYGSKELDKLFKKVYICSKKNVTFYDFFSKKKKKNHIIHYSELKEVFLYKLYKQLCKENQKYIDKNFFNTPDGLYQKNLILDYAIIFDKKQK